MRFLEHERLVLDPLLAMRRFQREMNNLFDEKPTSNEGRGEFPLVNLTSNSETVVLTAELPGVSLEKLDISVLGSSLTIRGERNEWQADAAPTFYRRERWQGAFVRTIDLPFSVSPQSVTADYCDGLLRITAPRAEEDKPKKIKVN